MNRLNPDVPELRASLLQMSLCFLGRLSQFKVPVSILTKIFSRPGYLKSITADVVDSFII